MVIGQSILLSSAIGLQRGDRKSFTLRTSLCKLTKRESVKICISYLHFSVAKTALCFSGIFEIETYFLFFPEIKKGLLKDRISKFDPSILS